MFKWYKEADICYAHLADVPTADVDFYRSDEPNMLGTFKASKWFTRGWTLQELIAPLLVEFYAEDWTDLGTKSSRRQEISTITGIDVRVLDGADPSICNVAERLSWAASRQTTRIEDAAYCLLGIFQVHMPLLYGEGERALIRLQEEILKTTEDYTLLLRGAPSDSYLEGLKQNNWPGALARQLSEFKIRKDNPWTYSNLEFLLDTSSSNTSKSLVADVTPTLTARGLHICLPLLKISHDEYLAHLYCKLKTTHELVCMPLVRDYSGENRFRRKIWIGRPEDYSDRSLVSPTRLSSFRLVTMYIRQPPLRLLARSLHNRSFSLSTFEVSSTTGTTLSEASSFRKCLVMTSWGSSTESLPWKTAMEELRNNLSFRSSALFVLGPGETFMVAFGCKVGKLWCCVLLGLESAMYPVNPEQSHEWDAWKVYDSFTPSVLVDRAWKKLGAGLRMVLVKVSIRIVSCRLVVNVHINETSDSSEFFEAIELPTRPPVGEFA
jgi:hypothetical protein